MIRLGAAGRWRRFGGGGGGGLRWVRRPRRLRWRWATDFPDSDLNFSLPSPATDVAQGQPWPITMRLTDHELFDYPFIYIIEPGACRSRRRKAPGCASYLSTAAS